MFKILSDFDVRGKRVIVRCDFNVPLNENGNVADDFKIRQTLPTIRYLIDSGARVILMSHLDGGEAEFTRLDPIKFVLENLLNLSVGKTDDCVGSKVEEEVSRLKDEEVLLLENLRFHKEETENSADFAKKLAELGDIYINDAFAVCHRAHASVVGVPKFLPRGAGFLLQKEVENLTKILQNPERPMAVLIGGSKILTKEKFIGRISQVADWVIVNGLIKKEMLDKDLRVKNPEKIIGPTDGLESFDINEKTAEVFRKKILSAKTIFWNGPFGRIEEENYKKGTFALAKAIIESGAFSVVGGGETIAFLRQEGLAEKFSWVSTGGGAMLEFLSGEELPGIVALE